jgi:hypothetical protein
MSGASFFQSRPLQTWLDAHALDDSVMAEAYESLSDKERAVLKKGIARQHVVWGEYSLRESRTRSFRQGFGVVEDDAPATYGLLVCEASYPSPAAFIAVLMPALLAGVSAVLPCFISAGGTTSRKDISAPLLGALELAGVERAFAASESEICTLAEMLRADSGRGRIVLLGGPGFGESLALHAHRAGVLCLSLTQPPLYYSDRLCAVLEHSFMQERTDPADAALCRDDDAAMFLHLDAAHEDVWFWPKLGPDWFRTRRMRIFSLQ